tara:strand:+ start:145 stop:579 length:435 start_codon:yes stop_codon:yes gene_type:complete
MEDREVQFRTVKQEDLHFVFLLLQQLNKIDYSLRSLNECWDKFINNNSSNSIVGICNGKIVAYGSIIIENKIRGELAGHVEDIVVDKKNRGKKTGIKLISELVKIAKSKKCYRVTLTCDNSLIKFYKKNGFIINNIAMKKYINL